MNDSKPDEYRDDAEALTDSSDLARRGTTGEYAGGGPDTSSQNFTPPKGRQDWQKRSDDHPDDADEETVESRSDDPGQSSYGGFRNDGPATPDGHPQDD